MCLSGSESTELISVDITSTRFSAVLFLRHNPRSVHASLGLRSAQRQACVPGGRRRPPRTRSSRRHDAGGTQRLSAAAARTVPRRRATAAAVHPTSTSSQLCATESAVMDGGSRSWKQRRQQIDIIRSRVPVRRDCR